MFCEIHIPKNADPEYSVHQILLFFYLRRAMRIIVNEVVYNLQQQPLGTYDAYELMMHNGIVYELNSISGDIFSISE